MINQPTTEQATKTLASINQLKLKPTRSFHLDFKIPELKMFVIFLSLLSF